MAKPAEFIDNHTPVTDITSSAIPGDIKRSALSLPVPNQTPQIESSQERLTAADALARAAKLKAGEVKDQPYYCIVCKHEYMGSIEGRNPCPFCNEHLYRRAL